MGPGRGRESRHPAIAPSARSGSHLPQNPWGRLNIVGVRSVLRDAEREGTSRRAQTLPHGISVRRSRISRSTRFRRCSTAPPCSRARARSRFSRPRAVTIPRTRRARRSTTWCFSARRRGRRALRRTACSRDAWWGQPARPAARTGRAVGQRRLFAHRAGPARRVRERGAGGARGLHGGTGDVPGRGGHPRGRVRLGQRAWAPCHGCSRSRTGSWTSTAPPPSWGPSTHRRSFRRGRSGRSWRRAPPSPCSSPPAPRPAWRPGSATRESWP